MGRKFKCRDRKILGKRKETSSHGRVVHNRCGNGALMIGRKREGGRKGIKFLGKLKELWQKKQNNAKEWGC